MNNTLKPCPFCGSKNVDVIASFGDATTNQNYMKVECIDCGAQGSMKLGEELAADAWNKR